MSFDQPKRKRGAALSRKVQLVARQSMMFASP